MALVEGSRAGVKKAKEEEEGDNSDGRCHR